jgi:hypothetical protein
VPLPGEQHPFLHPQRREHSPAVEQPDLSSAGEFISGVSNDTIVEQKPMHYTYFATFSKLASGEAVEIENRMLPWDLAIPSVL